MTGDTPAQGTEACLFEHARLTRHLFERLLQESIGSRATKGACAYACIMLKTSIEQFLGLKAQIQGGGPPDDGGYLDSTGVMRGHYWVVVAEASGSAWVVDITADQFGGPEVLVLPTDRAGRYRAGDQSVVDAGIAELAEDIDRALPVSIPV